jgi:hypothetical protein
VGEDRVEATKIGNGKLDKVRPTRKRKRKPHYSKGFDHTNLGPHQTQRDNCQRKKDVFLDQRKRTREMHKLGCSKISYEI